MEAPQSPARRADVPAGKTAPAGNPSAGDKSPGETSPGDARTSDALRGPHVLPQLVQETRRHVRGLLVELSRLARKDIAPAEFYGELLRRAVAATEAVGGAVWLKQADGSWSAQSQVNLDQSGTDAEPARSRHQALLARAAADGEGTIVPPRSGDGASGPNSSGPNISSPGNPTDLLRVLVPLHAGRRTIGVVETFHRPGSPLATQRGFLAFLKELCRIAGEYHERRAMGRLSRGAKLWRAWEEFCFRIHASLSSRATALAIVSEGRRVLQCDRLALAAPCGRSFRVVAISGQETFDARSGVVRAMNRLAGVSAKLGEPVWHGAGKSAEFAPDVERTVHDLSEISGSKVVAALPLVPPGHGGKSKSASRPEGVLLVEHFQEVARGDELAKAAAALARHASLAWHNAQEHDSIFGLSLWKSAGRLRGLVRLRMLPKTIAALTFAALVAAVMLIPIEFRIEARGVLQPVVRRDVFAPLDGVITAVNVEHGDHLPAGRPIDIEGQPFPPVRLRNLELEMALTRAQGERAQALSDLNSISVSLLNDKSLTPGQTDQLRGRKKQLEELRASLDVQLELLKKKADLLDVFSPIDGRVSTLDLKNRLLHLPVPRGAVLFSVSDPDGPWELDLRLPEDRMGHVLLAQNNLPAGKGLPVTFVLSSEPGMEFHGEVVAIHERAELYGEEGNAVRVRVRIDKSQLPHLREGAGVVGKLHCGQRALGYVLFHDVIEFVQSRVLFHF